MSLLEAKKALGKKAASLVGNGMIVGLGSGSTAECFIASLIDRVQNEGLSIQTVSSSRRSAELAEKGGLTVADINDIPRIDLTVDGADEIDPLKRMIKGGGGAHLREKILASASTELVIIVDESKWVPSVGRGKLPVEVLFYGSPATRMKIEQLGYKGHWRLTSDGSIFITDNGNLIFDVEFDAPPHLPEQVNEDLIHIPGVLETGFFFNLAGRVFTGYADGRVELSKGK
ncbi:MAG: ribose-5-phosphate isomerase RpiA [Verrucomicrobia bacterium]|nr:ribose-5-phosphate isomerase RpiA [Verrucomicrobiota bacterium]